MRASWLLALYPRRWRERYGAEIAELLRGQRLSARLVIDLVRGALDAHLHPELVAPLLAAAGGGTLQAPPRSPRVGTYVLAVILLLFLVFGGLYASRSQTPAIPSVPVTQVMDELQRGRVKAIDFVGTHATVTLIDATRQQATVAQTPDEPLRRAVDDYNATHPTAKVAYSYSSDTSPLSYVLPPLFSLLITVLPLALLALLIVVLAKRLATDHGDARRASRYEWLARLADLRDRGVLTEDEFQREKTRLLE